MMGPAWAVAGLGWRESWRGRLWILPLLAILALAIAAPRLSAVDDAGRVRLLTVVVLTAAGFAAVLLASLVPAQQVRRDLENRSALMLFPKPLSRWSYLLGRWLGGLLIAATASLLIASAGGGLVGWQAGWEPARGTITPSHWWSVSGLGEVIDQPGNRDRLQLAGPSGDGVRWRFVGLEPGHEQELLVRARLRGFDASGAIEVTPLRIVALPGDGVPLPLALDTASPYGAAPAGAGVSGANAWLRGREPDRKDLSGDWLRLRLPAAAIAADGAATVQITRLDPAATVEVWRDASCLVAVPAGPIPIHVVRAAIADLAGVAVLAAAACAVATVSNLAVALLACLALWFGGNAVSTVREVLSWGDTSVPMARLLDLLATVLPDLGGIDRATRIASGAAVSWAMVGSAWLAILPHLAALLLLGWWAMSRREL